MADYQYGKNVKTLRLADGFDDEQAGTSEQGGQTGTDVPPVINP